MSSFADSLHPSVGNAKRSFAFGLRTHPWLVAVGVWLASACSSEPAPTGAVVVVVAEPLIAGETTTLVVRVYGADGTSTSGEEVLREQRTVAIGAAQALPYTFGVRPLRGDATRLYRVEVEARDASGGLLATARALSGYVPGRVISLELVFDDACRGVTCADAATTCRAAVCVDAHVDPTTLPTYGSDAGVGVDAGADTGVVGCGAGYAPSDGGCVDVDECATNNGGCGSAACMTCTNNLGAAPTCTAVSPSAQAPITQLDFAGAPVSIVGFTPVAPIVPTVAGEITSCTSNPPLPSGLVLDATTCTLRGVATQIVASASYVITAANDCTSRPATIQLAVMAETETATDPATGLTWMRCPIGQTYDTVAHACTGTPTLLQFCTTATNDCNGGNAASPLGTGFLAGATSSAFTACDQLVLDGFSDWRVPDITDLRSIRVCSTGATALGGDNQDACNAASTAPTIDSVVFPWPQGNYWSRQTSYWNTGWGMFMSTTDGSTAATGKFYDTTVACVRP